MPLILNIDTATETASIALADDKGLCEMMMNREQKDHAAWIHSAIEQLIKKSGCTLRDLDAVAVTEGPGSYTGLRVGLATAKGFCYALGIPLITESTLRVMAHAKHVQHPDMKGVLFCPMIDARRMEVFTAVYDDKLEEIMKPAAMVLDERSFAGILSEREIVFFGSGSDKFRNIAPTKNAVFIGPDYDASHLSSLPAVKFRSRNFTDPAYAEPAYLKEFYTHTRK